MECRLLGVRVLVVQVGRRRSRVRRATRARSSTAAAQAAPDSSSARGVVADPDAALPKDAPASRRAQTRGTSTGSCLARSACRPSPAALPPLASQPSLDWRGAWLSPLVSAREHLACASQRPASVVDRPTIIIIVPWHARPSCPGPPRTSTCRGRTPRRPRRHRHRRSRALLAASAVRSSTPRAAPSWQSAPSAATAPTCARASASRCRSWTTCTTS